jgi:hypothetical protein
VRLLLWLLFVLSLVSVASAQNSTASSSACNYNGALVEDCSGTTGACTFVCDCYCGYSGAYCDSAYQDLCSGQQCNTQVVTTGLSPGSCVINSTTCAASCACSEYYTSTNVTSITTPCMWENPCTPSPCGLHSSGCVVNSPGGAPSYNCTCEPGWTWNGTGVTNSNCNQWVNPCLTGTNPCGLYGTCMAVTPTGINQDYYCTCDPGYGPGGNNTGCGTSVCMSATNCNGCNVTGSYPSYYSCTSCQNGYTGTACQTSPCEGPMAANCATGECAITSSSPYFTCNSMCQDGWSGTTCSTGACSMAGAQCVDCVPNSSGSYACASCLYGFTSTSGTMDCSVWNDPCDASPCGTSTEGTCSYNAYGVNNQYTCVCQPGYGPGGANSECNPIVNSTTAPSLGSVVVPLVPVSFAGTSYPYLLQFTNDTANGECYKTSTDGVTLLDLETEIALPACSCSPLTETVEVPCDMSGCNFMCCDNRDTGSVLYDRRSLCTTTKSLIAAVPQQPSCAIQPATGSAPIYKNVVCPGGSIRFLYVYDSVTQTAIYVADDDDPRFYTTVAVEASLLWQFEPTSQCVVSDTLDLTSSSTPTGWLTQTVPSASTPDSMCSYLTTSPEGTASQDYSTRTCNMPYQHPSTDSDADRLTCVPYSVTAMCGELPYTIFIQPELVTGSASTDMFNATTPAPEWLLPLPADVYNSMQPLHFQCNGLSATLVSSLLSTVASTAETGCMQLMSVCSVPPSTRVGSLPSDYWTCLPPNESNLTAGLFCAVPNTTTSISLPCDRVSYLDVGIQIRCFIDTLSGITTCLHDSMANTLAPDTSTDDSLYVNCPLSPSITTQYFTPLLALSANFTALGITNPMTGANVSGNAPFDDSMGSLTSSDFLSINWYCTLMNSSSNTTELGSAYIAGCTTTSGGVATAVPAAPIIYPYSSASYTPGPIQAVGSPNQLPNSTGAGEPTSVYLTLNISSAVDSGIWPDWSPTLLNSTAVVYLLQTFYTLTESACAALLVNCNETELQCMAVYETADQVSTVAVYEGDTTSFCAEARPESCMMPLGYSSEPTIGQVFTVPCSTGPNSYPHEIQCYYNTTGSICYLTCTILDDHLYMAVSNVPAFELMDLLWIQLNGVPATQSWYAPWSPEPACNYLYDFTQEELADSVGSGIAESDGFVCYNGFTTRYVGDTAPGWTYNASTSEVYYICYPETPLQQQVYDFQCGAVHIVCTAQNGVSSLNLSTPYTCETAADTFTLFPNVSLAIQAYNLTALELAPTLTLPPFETPACNSIYAAAHANATTTETPVFECQALPGAPSTQYVFDDGVSGCYVWDIPYQPVPASVLTQDGVITPVKCAVPDSSEDPWSVGCFWNTDTPTGEEPTVACFSFTPSDTPGITASYPIPPLYAACSNVSYTLLAEVADSPTATDNATCAVIFRSCQNPIDTWVCNAPYSLSPEPGSGLCLEDAAAPTVYIPPFACGVLPPQVLNCTNLGLEAQEGRDPAEWVQCTNVPLEYWMTTPQALLPGGDASNTLLQSISPAAVGGEYLYLDCMVPLAMMETQLLANVSDWLLPTNWSSYNSIFSVPQQASACEAVQMACIMPQPVLCATQADSISVTPNSILTNIPVSTAEVLEAMVPHYCYSQGNVTCQNPAQMCLGYLCQLSPTDVLVNGSALNVTSSASWSQINSGYYNTSDPGIDTIIYESQSLSAYVSLNIQSAAATINSSSAASIASNFGVCVFQPEVSNLTCNNGYQITCERLMLIEPIGQYVNYQCYVPDTPYARPVGSYLNTFDCEISRSLFVNVTATIQAFATSTELSLVESQEVQALCMAIGSECVSQGQVTCNAALFQSGAYIQKIQYIASAAQPFCTQPQVAPTTSVVPIIFECSNLAVECYTVEGQVACMAAPGSTIWELTTLGANGQVAGGYSESAITSLSGYSTCSIPQAYNDTWYTDPSTRCLVIAELCTPVCLLPGYASSLVLPQPGSDEPTTAVFCEPTDLVDLVLEPVCDGQPVLCSPLTSAVTQQCLETAGCVEWCNPILFADYEQDPDYGRNNLQLQCVSFPAGPTYGPDSNGGLDLNCTVNEAQMLSAGTSTDETCRSMVAQCAANYGTYQCNAPYRMTVLEPFCTLLDVDETPSPLCDCGVWWSDSALGTAAITTAPEPLYELIGSAYTGIYQTNAEGTAGNAQNQWMAAVQGCASRGMIPDPYQWLAYFATDYATVMPADLSAPLAYYTGVDWSLDVFDTRSTATWAGTWTWHQWWCGTVLASDIFTPLAVASASPVEFFTQVQVAYQGAGSSANITMPTMTWYPECARLPGMRIPLCTVECPGNLIRTTIPGGTAQYCCASGSTESCTETSDGRNCMLGNQDPLTYANGSSIPIVSTSMWQLPSQICPDNLFADIVSFPTSDAVVSDSLVDQYMSHRQLCYHDTACQGVVIIPYDATLSPLSSVNPLDPTSSAPTVSHGVYFLSRFPSFSLAVLEELDPRRVHQYDTELEYHLHWVADDEEAELATVYSTSTWPLTIAPISLLIERFYGFSCTEYRLQWPIYYQQNPDVQQRVAARIQNQLMSALNNDTLLYSQVWPEVQQLLQMDTAEDCADGVCNEWGWLERLHNAWSPITIFANAMAPNGYNSNATTITNTTVYLTDVTALLLYDNFRTVNLAYQLTLDGIAATTGSNAPGANSTDQLYVNLTATGAADIDEQLEWRNEMIDRFTTLTQVQSKEGVRYRLPLFGTYAGTFDGFLRVFDTEISDVTSNYTISYGGVGVDLDGGWSEGNAALNAILGVTQYNVAQQSSTLSCVSLIIAYLASHGMQVVNATTTTSSNQLTLANVQDLCVQQLDDLPSADLVGYANMPIEADIGGGQVLPAFLPPGSAGSATANPATLEGTADTDTTGVLGEKMVEVIEPETWVVGWMDVPTTVSDEVQLWSIWQLVAYFTWRDWYLYGYRTVSYDRVSPNSVCTLNTPLWVESATCPDAGCPASYGDSPPACAIPRCPRPYQTGLQWSSDGDSVTSTAAYTPFAPDPMPLNPYEDLDAIPCAGFGTCSSTEEDDFGTGLCMCPATFDVQSPIVLDGTLVGGISQIPAGLQNPACGIDTRISCYDPNEVTQACGGPEQGVCLVALLNTYQGSECTCGSFPDSTVRLDPPTPCDVYPRDCEYCNIPFQVNSFTGDMCQAPMGNCVAPGWTYDADLGEWLTSTTWTRSGPAGGYLPGDSYSCTAPRMMDAMAAATGTCTMTLEPGATAYAYNCTCPEGTYGDWCQYNTLAANTNMQTPVETGCFEDNGEGGWCAWNPYTARFDPVSAEMQGQCSNATAFQNSVNLCAVGVNNTDPDAEYEPTWAVQGPLGLVVPSEMCMDLYTLNMNAVLIASTSTVVTYASAACVRCQQLACYGKGVCVHDEMNSPTDSWYTLESTALEGDISQAIQIQVQEVRSRVSAQYCSCNAGWGGPYCDIPQCEGVAYNNATCVQHYTSQTATASWMCPVDADGNPLATGSNCQTACNGNGNLSYYQVFDSLTNTYTNEWNATCACNYPYYSDKSANGAMSFCTAMCALPSTLWPTTVAFGMAQTCIAGETLTSNTTTMAPTTAPPTTAMPSATPSAMPSTTPAATTGIPMVCDPPATTPPATTAPATSYVPTTPAPTLDNGLPGLPGFGLTFTDPPVTTAPITTAAPAPAPTCHPLYTTMPPSATPTATTAAATATPAPTTSAASNSTAPPTNSSTGTASKSLSSVSPVSTTLTASAVVGLAVVGGVILATMGFMVSSMFLSPFFKTLAPTWFM